MPRHALYALPILALALSVTSCSGPRETVASVPYHRVAEVDLAKTYRTIGTRTVGEDAAYLDGVERDAVLPGLTVSPFDEADVRVEIVSGSLAHQVVLTDSGPVHNPGGEVAGYVHWTDVLFSQKGLVRVSDRDGRELFRENVDYSSKVEWGFSVRGPGKNMPQSGDSRFSQLGSSKSYYTRGEASTALRENWPVIVTSIRDEVRRQFGWSLTSFVKRSSSGRDTTYVSIYANGERGFLTPTRAALESGERALLEREQAALVAIVAGGYADPGEPEKKTPLKPAQRAALHVNLGTLFAALGNREGAEREFERARSFDRAIAATADKNRTSLAVLTPPADGPR